MEMGDFPLDFVTSRKMVEAQWWLTLLQGREPDGGWAAGSPGDSAPPT